LENPSFSCNFATLHDLMIMMKSSENKGITATGAGATGTDKTSNHVVKKKR
jgi:hypothetical protein